MPSANRITLLRDADGDGIAETRTVFLEGLNSPFGMALVGSDLYVANTDAVVRFPYTAGATRITAAGTKVVDLPAGPRNHHWTKNVVASRDGSQAVRHGRFQQQRGRARHGRGEGRAAIWEVDRKSGAHRLFATGLRNPNGLAWEPTTGVLWTVVNERDELGSDLVPDYLTSVREGGFYGWPYSYFGSHSIRVSNRSVPISWRRRSCPITRSARTSRRSGLAMVADEQLAVPPSTTACSSGSTDRGTGSRARAIKCLRAIHERQACGRADRRADGIRQGRGRAIGRPVAVAIDSRGGLLVADDVGNIVWRVTAAR